MMKPRKAPNNGEHLAHSCCTHKDDSGSKPFNYKSRKQDVVKYKYLDMMGIKVQADDEHLSATRSGD